MKIAQPIENEIQGIVLMGQPVDIIYFDHFGLPCRWLNEETDNEQFQVRLDGVWFNAQSIDFKIL